MLRPEEDSVAFSIHAWMCGEVRAAQGERASAGERGSERGARSLGSTSRQLHAVGMFLFPRTPGETDTALMVLAARISLIMASSCSGTGPPRVRCIRLPGGEGKSVMRGLPRPDSP